VAATRFRIIDLLESGDRSVAACAKPDFNAVSLRTFERANVAKSHLRIAVEIDGSAYRSRAERRIASDRPSMLIAASRVGEAAVEFIVSCESVARRLSNPGDGSLLP